MEFFGGLDVSIDETAVCMVDDRIHAPVKGATRKTSASNLRRTEFRSTLP